MSDSRSWGNMEICKTFLTLIGKPAYETWLEYPEYSALDEDEKKAKEFVNCLEWDERTSEMSVVFQRVSSKVVKEI